MACSINTGIVVGNVNIYLSQSWETRPLVEVFGDRLIDRKVVRFNESSTFLNQGLMLSANTVARLCGLRQSCYFIVGVYGVPTERVNELTRDRAAVTDVLPQKRSSTFTLMYSSSDDVTDLLNLVSIDSQCNWNKPQFYRFVLTRPSVVCSLSKT